MMDETQIPAGLNFFEWYAARERRDDDPRLPPEQETEWIRGFVHGYVWESYSSPHPIHDGDCTNMPYTCNLCALQGLLSDYEEYRFGYRADHCTPEERAVIEAACADMIAFNTANSASPDTDNLVRLRTELIRAVDALLAARAGKETE